MDADHELVMSLYSQTPKLNNGFGIRTKTSNYVEDSKDLTSLLNVAG
jgi:hypothetical protein